MINNILDEAIRNGNSVEILYSKNNQSPNSFHLTNVSYSAEYGKDYITGYSCEYEKELTFKIEKIIDVNYEWIDLLAYDQIAPLDGLYLIVFSHWAFEYEFKIQKKGNQILEEFREDEMSGIGNCDFAPDHARAYYYIPFYNNDSLKKWINFEYKVDTLEKGIYIFAYKFKDNKLKNKEVRFIKNLWRYSEGIYYSPFILSDKQSFDNLNIVHNRHIDIIAYFYCSEYTYKDRK